MGSMDDVTGSTKFGTLISGGDLFLIGFDMFG